MGQNSIPTRAEVTPPFSIAVSLFTSVRSLQSFAFDPSENEIVKIISPYRIGSPISQCHEPNQATDWKCYIPLFLNYFPEAFPPGLEFLTVR